MELVLIAFLGTLILMAGELCDSLRRDRNTANPEAATSLSSHDVVSRAASSEHQGSYDAAA